MVWYNLKINYKNKVFDCKYKGLAIEEVEYPYCDSEGNILKKVSGKFEKGYFINEDTQQTHDKAYRLINGKASKGFSGRIKEVIATIVNEGENEDLLIDKEYLLENEELYNLLVENKEEIKFLAFFGTGYKAYKVYVYPSKLFNGFCIMKCGRGNKSDIMKDLIQDRDDLKNLTEKLNAIELVLNKVNLTKMEDLITL
jgi:hypothetical protein